MTDRIRVTGDRATVAGIRAVLLDGAHYTDQALIGMIRQVMERFGSWSEQDSRAFEARREVFAVAEHPDLLAYDGSNEPQKRPLTARDRDILTRLVRQAAADARRPADPHLGVLAALVEACREDPRQLDELAWALDPRPL